MSTILNSHLILIRTPIKPIEDDQYNSIKNLNPNPFLSINHLPVLSTNFLPSIELSSIIEAGPDQKYSGVIITSNRSVEAWLNATKLLNERNSNFDSRLNWSNTPFFVVGPGTRDGLLRLKPPPSDLIIGANDSGSGERLAKFIIGHFNSQFELHSSSSNSVGLPLLALVGDKNRDTLPRLLKENNIEIEKIKVYETNPEVEFENRLVELLKSTEVKDSASDQLVIVWIVLFSPSGAKHCLEMIKKVGITLKKVPKVELNTSTSSIPTPPESVEEGESELQQQLEGIVGNRRFRLAAIGPTTKAYVEEDEGFQVDAMAQSPDPEDLLKALRNALP